MKSQQQKFVAKNSSDLAEIELDNPRISANDDDGDEPMDTSTNELVNLKGLWMLFSNR